MCDTICAALLDVQRIAQLQQRRVDAGATFNFQTGEQVDTNFGRLTGATLSARRIQLAARFTF